MAFVRTWNRLEPLARHRTLSDGLEARLADPAWLLGRQWQFGEFQGSDGGQPVLAKFEADRGALMRFQPGPGTDPNTPAKDFDVLRDPLEVLVEAEHADGTFDMAFWLSTGTDLQRSLKGLGASSTTMRSLRQAYPFGEAELAAIPFSSDKSRTEATALLALWSGRAIDAERLFADVSVSIAGPAPALPATLAGLPPTEAAKVITGATNWIARIKRPRPSDAPSWQSDHMEYSFAVATDFDGETTLEAREYRGSRLDWHAFDARRDRAMGTAAAGTTRVTRAAIPVPVEYPGMPADRYWAIEDHPVRFGQIATGRTDLARTLLAEFALVYGNDWFVLPLDLPLGSLVGNLKVTVTDSFGAMTEIKPDPKSATTLFQVSATQDEAKGLFLVVPAMVGWDVGDPIEEVSVVRDELANLFWGIEHRVADGLGGARLRAEEPDVAASAPQAVPEEAELIYRLTSDVPPHWIPYVPEHEAIGTVKRTVLMQRPVATLHPDGSRSAATPEGEILAGSTLIRPEEVTRAGFRVVRQMQVSRWIDGTYHLWIGRTRRVGKGESSSGLRHDFTQEV